MQFFWNWSFFGYWLQIRSLHGVGVHVLDLSTFFLSLIYSCLHLQGAKSTSLWMQHIWVILSSHTNAIMLGIVFILFEFLLFLLNLCHLLHVSGPNCCLRIFNWFVLHVYLGWLVVVAWSFDLLGQPWINTIDVVNDFSSDWVLRLQVFWKVFPRHQWSIFEI